MQPVFKNTCVIKHQFQQQLKEIAEDIGQVLIEKNKSYGNSALEPVRIFSKASHIEQINVRIDDKLSRIARGSEYPGDDTIRDLIGYLVLLLIAQSDPMVEFVFSQRVKQIIDRITLPDDYLSCDINERIEDKLADIGCTDGYHRNSTIYCLIDYLTLLLVLKDLKFERQN